MRAPKTIVAAVALTAITGMSVAACGSSNSSSAAAGGSSSSSAAKPVAALTNLTGTSTSVTLAPSFLAGLKALKLTPGLIGGATLNGAVLSFPITGGNATYYTPGTQPAGQPYVQAVIDHNGSGFTLAAGGTTVGLSNFTVNAGTSMLLGDVTANGTSVAKQTPLFFLDGRTLNALDTTSVPGSAVLQGTTVSILPAAATLLDKTFKTTAITPYFLVGVATITLKLPASS